MSTNTHSLHTIEPTDNAFDAPNSVRAHAATAEQRALNQLFGLDLPTTANDQVGALIAERIFNIVRNVYTSLDQVGLSELISQNVTRAINEVDPANRGLRNADRIHAVAKAAYESIPQDLLERFAVVTLPARISEDDLGHPTGAVRIQNLNFAAPSPLAGAPKNLSLNTDILFWRQNEDMAGNSAALSLRIEGRTPQEIGVVGALWPAGHVLTAAEADVIANAQEVIVLAQPEGAGKCEYEYGPPGPSRPKLDVNVDKMMKESTTADAPAGMQNRPIYTFDADDIEQLFNHRGEKGDYPYWKKYCTGPANPHVGINNLVCNYPGIVPPVVVAPALGPATEASRVASEIVRIVHGQPTRLDRIGNREITMLDAQRDIHRKMEENTEFLGRLRSGSENGNGAILAASLAISDPKILAKVAKLADETKLKKERTEVQKKQSIVAELEKLRQVPANFKLSALPGVPGAVTFAGLEAELTSLKADAGCVSTGSALPPAISAHAASMGLLPGAIVPPANRTATLNQLQGFRKQVEEDIATHEKFSSILQTIARDAVDAELYNSSGTLRRYVTNPTTLALDKAAFSSASVPVNIAEEIKKEMSIESEAELKEKLEKAEAGLKKLKAGGEKGDQLQQKVFQEHLKAQGVSEEEARKSANYLYSRTLIDAELRGQMDALQNDIFGDEEIGRTALDDLNPVEALRRSKEYKVVNNIARSVGLPPRVTRNAYLPNLLPAWTHRDWQTLSYPRLITAYYSFKKLYDGLGPAYLNGPGSTVYRDQMDHIARAIRERHVTALINDFGNDLSDEDRAKLGSRKTLALDLVKKLLTGEPPAGDYQTRIDRILYNVDGGTNRYRRALYRGASTATRATVGTAGYLAKGGLNGLSKGKNFVVRNRKDIAACAALTALGGPLGFATYLGYKAFTAPATHTALAA